MPEFLAGLFASGRIVDLILGFVVLEALLLLVLRRRLARPPGAADIIVALLPGVALMLALRAALADAWWGLVALCLAAALVAHLADLLRRWGLKPERPDRGASSD